MAAVPDDARRGRARLTPWTVGAVLLGAFVGGAALRWAVMSSVLSYVDIDEATVGIQGRDFFARPDVFFPAQSYGGTLEVPFVALLDSLGADGPVALKLVPMGFHLAAAWCSGPSPGAFVPAQLGVWAAPVHPVVRTGVRRLGIQQGARLLRRFDPAGDDRGAARAAAAGGHDRWAGHRPRFAIGLSIWATPLLATVVVPMVIWSAVRRPVLWRLIPAVGLARSPGRSRG